MKYIEEFLLHDQSEYIKNFFRKYKSKKDIKYYKYQKNLLNKRDNTIEKLAKPFTLDEICEYENKHKVISPTEIRYYLINISREILSYNSCLINLDKKPFEYELSEDGYEYESFYDSFEIDDKNIRFTKNKFISITNNDDDSIFNIELCISGFHYGKYGWYNNDLETFILDNTKNYFFI